MITIPETFECACFKWRVRFVPKLAAFGETNFNKYEIRLREGLEGDLLAQTFMHEVLHVVNDAMGLTHLNKKRKDDLVDAYAAHIYQVFKSARGNAAGD